MTCYHPQTIYIYEKQLPDGSFEWIANYTYNWKLACRPVRIPCKQCVGCRADKSREWGLRATLESYYHKKAMFLTLTYNDENLPNNKSLKKTHMVQFNKKLREHLARKENLKIRTLYCGEYGTKKGRPHYHEIIYGWKANDMIFLKKTEKGENLYKSKFLNELWGKGWVTIGKVSQESCNYVAQYCTKKEKKLDNKYIRVKKEGIIEEREQEFIEMSRRKGIGYEYLNKHKEKICNQGTINIKGKKLPVPNYIKKILGEKNELKDILDISRIENQKEQPKLTKSQLRKKELNHIARIKKNEKNKLTSEIDI